jgi:hypothetical protein
MKREASAIRIVIAAAMVASGVLLVSARVDVTVYVDKAFNFSAAPTWGWHPEESGRVMMARTQEDDPEAMRQRVEPLIIEAVATEMAGRGRQQAPAAPHLLVTYYLLLSTNVSAQTLGQFVPATPDWGLPPLTGATQSLKVMNKGSLVLDFSADGRIVWRGVAEAKIEIGTDAARRERLLRQAVRDLLRRFPKT